MAMSSKAVKIQAEPAIALVDDVVNISITGLDPFQSTTFTAFLDEDGKMFMSHAFYVSNANGNIDLSVMPSTGGCYSGIEPMGFLWSMKPAAGQMPGLRLLKTNVETPLLVDLFVHEGHRRMTSKEDLVKYKDFLLASTQVQRYYQSPDVLAFPVRTGSIRGILYLPSGDGPFPGVIDMFGTAGGLIKFRSALLASRGFASLALAYFDYEDLPKHIDLRLEYFEEAIDWLHRHPLVMKTGIGVVAVSKGGTLALDMASRSHKVKAVVCINGNALHAVGLHYYNGQPQFVLNPEGEEMILRQTEEGLEFGDSYAITDKYKQHVIPRQLSSTEEKQRRIQWLRRNPGKGRCRF